MAQTTVLATLQAHLSAGQFLNPATAHFPAVVLGADAARALGIDQGDGSVQVWLGSRWFSVVGILDGTRWTRVDLSALVGFPIAEQMLGSDGAPVEIYVRTDPTSVDAVASVLPASADPAAPQDVSITNPTDALIARADASAAFQSLFLALGAVALVVGGVGIANVMVISVLERRSEIGLRRALGARRVHVRLQFVTEAVLISLLGGRGRSSTRWFHDRHLCGGPRLEHGRFAPRLGRSRWRSRDRGRYRRGLSGDEGGRAIAFRGVADRMNCDAIEAL